MFDANEKCEVCGAKIEQPLTGRRRRTCSNSCRQMAYRLKGGDMASIVRMIREAKDEETAKNLAQMAQRLVDQAYAERVNGDSSVTSQGKKKARKGKGRKNGHFGTNSV